MVTYLGGAEMAKKSCFADMGLRTTDSILSSLCFLLLLSFYFEDLQGPKHYNP